MDADEKKIKELTALHAEVSGRNVTLHCKNLELESLSESWKKQFMEEAEIATALDLKAARLEWQVKVLREGLESIAAKFPEHGMEVEVGRMSHPSHITNCEAYHVAKETLKASEKWAEKGL